jgi:SAM-dependent methyltransferase
VRLPISTNDYYRFCNHAYAVARRWLVPTLRNSQYAYAEALRTALANRGRWLDLGCGHELLPGWMPGRDTALDLSRWTVVGIDMDEGAIRQHARLRFRIIGNIEALPFGSETFDLITANMVVEHLKDPPRVFRELARVLTPSGMVIIHTPNLTGYTTALARLIPKSVVRFSAHLLLGRKQADVYPTFYRANSLGRIKIMAPDAGLDVASFAFVDSSPQLIRIPPAMWVEMLLIRLLQRRSLARYRACMVVTLRRSPRVRCDGPATCAVVRSIP